MSKKSHVSNIGGYSIDGCREFLPAGAEGTTIFFKCAACECHRNFHCIVPATTLVMTSSLGIHISMEDLEENVHVRHIEPINDHGAEDGTSKSNKRFWQSLPMSKGRRSWILL